MKINLLLICLIAAVNLFNPIYPVYAQRPTPSLKSQKLMLLETKLYKFKDKSRSAKVLKINTKINELNTKRMDVLSGRLSVLNSTLDKTEDEVNKLAGEGKAVESARSAVANARDKIKNAQESVEGQKKYEYVVDLNAENSALADIRSVRDKLVRDIKSQIEVVQKTKVALKQAQKAVFDIANSTK